MWHLRVIFKQCEFLRGLKSKLVEIHKNGKLLLILSCYKNSIIQGNKVYGQIDHCWLYVSRLQRKKILVSAMYSFLKLGYKWNCHHIKLFQNVNKNYIHNV